MDEEEFQRKFINLRILKGIQEYLKGKTNAETALHPVRVPNELLYQLVRLRGAEEADNIIHKIFQMGLEAWYEMLYSHEFGSEESLEAFIRMVRDRNRAD
jgi:hypothetical protein